MKAITQTRVETRALVAAVVVGVLVGFSVGGAYWAGGMAQAATTHARVTRLAMAADGDYSDAAFQEAAARMEPGALAIARQHDPYTTAGPAERDRQASLLAVRLVRLDDHRTQPSGGMLLRASLGGAFNPAAAPFRMTGALDSARDLDCLTSAVYYEARGESSAGQAAVAQVVLNRVRHPAFPKTICGVVFQGAYGGGTCQFSFACDGSMRRGREGGAWTRSRGVAARALSGYVMSDVGNATNFHTTYVNPGWRSQMMRVAQVGDHVFYRFGGHFGAPDAFTRQPGRSTTEQVSRPIYASATSGPVSVTADGQVAPPMAAQAMVVTAAAQSNGMGAPPVGASEPASASSAASEARSPATKSPASKSATEIKSVSPVLKPAPTPSTAS
ncbi:MAG: cell wall hydrolase SleB [Caulobacter sp.]|nr:cell wall hydrolase SleB [Caulobacter sp.]